MIDPVAFRIVGDTWIDCPDCGHDVPCRVVERDREGFATVVVCRGCLETFYADGAGEEATAWD